MPTPISFRTTWQSTNGYTATGLASSSAYTFQVMARDQAGNLTARSDSASATTAPPPPAKPTNMVADGASETGILITWTDIADDETGYPVERSADGQGAFGTIASLGADSNTYTDIGLTADTAYDYRVAAFNDSGGKPANRHTYLEHRWNFNVSNGASVTVYANAWSEGSNDGDEFVFEYSLNNGGSFTELFTVSSTDESNLQSAAIPGAPSGNILIRVADTDQTSGHMEKNTVFVDHLYIQVGNPSNDPPGGDPSNMSASAVSSSQINLSWSNGSTNESGLILERSPNGSNGWTEIADLPSGSSSHSDTGLAPLTTYHYRVSAYTQPSLISAYDSANETTPDAPPPPDLSLSASGFKTKGKHAVSLSLSGSNEVDVYRDGDLKVTVSGNSYDDNIGAKGGATYTHKVCAAGTDTCSNTTETVF